MSMNAVHINIVMTVGFFYDLLGAVVLGLDVAASKFFIPRLGNAPFEKIKTRGSYMDIKEVLKKSRQYYNDFEDFKGYVSFLHPRFLAVCITFTAFVLGGTFLLWSAFQDDVSWYVLIVVAFFYASFLLSLKKLLEFHNEKIRKRFEDIFPKSICSDLSSIRRERLAQLWSCRPNKFYEKAKDINDAKLLYEENKGLMFDGRSFWGLVFEREAKQRILALSIFIASLITVLSVAQGSSLEMVFKFYGTVDLSFVMALYALIVILLFALLLAFSFLAKLIYAVGKFSSWRFGIDREFGSYVIRYMIRDMVVHHDFS